VPQRSPANTPNETDQVETKVHEAETPFPEPKLSPQVIALIGDSLRSYYDRMMLEPVPQHLIDLVDRMHREGRPSDEP
jgi:hypothetical protein